MSLSSMRVTSTPGADALATARAMRATAGTPARSLFATALAGATSSGGVTASAATTRTTQTTAATSPTATAAKEETRPVEGKPYEEILSGPRNGMFVNRSGNSRDGEAFVLVKKDGRDVHIYGSGKNRETVVVWHDEDKKPTAGADGVPAGEVSAPVPGKLYDEITAGPRNGMFINRSGNVRDGLPFVLVRHEHSEDHVYGSGKERQVVRVWDEGYGPEDRAATGGHTAAAQPS
ncbi:MAG TPA: hypothetical protein VN213_08720 [Solirubrobacteraceae bacterium]|nr:hypothetical protein [Solirubrobacteraceae bacterium]